MGLRIWCVMHYQLCAAGFGIQFRPDDANTARLGQDNEIMSFNWYSLHKRGVYQGSKTAY